MKSLAYLQAIKSQRSYIEKRATVGERVMSGLFPSRGMGYTGWGENQLKQVQHLRNWTYVAINCICSKIASIMPNMAYVVHQEKPGITVKAGQRGLLNLMGKGFGGSPMYGEGGLLDYSSWNPDQQVGNAELSFSGADHSYLTMGEYRAKSLGGVVKPHEELEPLEIDHPLRRLIENPNPVDTTFDLLYELQMFEELTGVSYLWAIPNKWGVPCELWVIPSHWVWPRTGDGKYADPSKPHSDELIQYFEVRPWGTTGSAYWLKLPPNEVVMNRWKSPLNKISGYSKLTAIAQWIDSEESISASRWSQFQNCARPEFWVELGAGYEDPDDDRIARLEAKFAAKIQGEYNYGRPLVTPPGARVTPLSFSPAEMTYFQSETQICEMILSAFQIPKSAVGLSEGMTYGSVLATIGAMCANCINPRLAMRGQNLTKHLAGKWSDRDRKIRIWWDDTVPADPAQVNSDIQVDSGQYAISPNELRALRGRKPWRFGGANPIGSGSYGPMPFPFESRKEVMEWGQVMADYAKLTLPKEITDQDATAIPGEETHAEGESDSPLEQLMMEHEGGPEEEDDGIEEANGKPSKKSSEIPVVLKGVTVNKGHTEDADAATARAIEATNATGHEEAMKHAFRAGVHRDRAYDAKSARERANAHRAAERAHKKLYQIHYDNFGYTRANIEEIPRLKNHQVACSLHDLAAGEHHQAANAADREARREQRKSISGPDRLEYLAAEFLETRKALGYKE